MSAEAAVRDVVAGPERAVRRRVAGAVVVGAYAAAIASAEVLAVAVGAVPAAALDGMLLVALVVHHLVSSADGAADDAAIRARVFPALALVPLWQLSTLAIAPGDAILFHVVAPAPALHVAPDLSGVLRTELAAVPLLLATVLAAPALGLPGVLPVAEIRRPAQWAFAAVAAAAGLAATPVLGLGPLSDAHGVHRLAPVLAIVVVLATLEELVFRGMVQGALAPVTGAASVLVADALFTATYAASGSPSYTLVMAAFGLACGWWVRRTGSVAGVAAGHVLFAAGLLIVWPAVL